MFSASARRTSFHSDTDTASPNLSADRLSQPFLPSEEKYMSNRRQRPTNFFQALPWALTLFFMVTSIVQFSRQLPPLCGFSKTGVRATDFSTKLSISLFFHIQKHSMRGAITLKTKTLTRIN